MLHSYMLLMCYYNCPRYFIFLSLLFRLLLQVDMNSAKALEMQVEELLAVREIVYLIMPIEK